MDLRLVSARPRNARVFNSILRVAISCAAIGGPIEGRAQVVTPKTLPVLQNGQFDMFPSARAGMGGATIAVDDTLLDPFVNPAKAARIGSAQIFGAPFFHNVSGGRGGGRTLPIGGSGAIGSWSATGLFTFQQLDRAGPTWNLSTSERSALNQYLAGSVARRLSASTSVGFGLAVASLDAIDGVDLLYAGSDRIKQSGKTADLRLGLTRDLGESRHFELLLLHARTDMRHDVRFSTWRWDPIARRSIQEQRIENNEDRTRILGLHSEYVRPLGTEGWRIGWLGTVNRLSHPKIPNYVIQNIPRDPGMTYSYNGGIGIGRAARGTSFAADLIFEPMFANTWADALNDTAVAGGGTIKAGAKTVENTFRFNNLKARFGVGRDINIRSDGSTVLGYQFGLGLYAINYRLDQTNRVLRTDRTQEEDWVEWTPTFGLRLRARELDLMYNFTLTCGPGACGQSMGGGPMFAPGLAASAAGGIIVAPGSTLFMQSGALKVHKVTISLPIR